MRVVLFINMGGAENLKDCELFLKNMFNDPYILTIKNKTLRAFVAFCITKARLKAMQDNYRHLGGKSPLNAITKSLCAKLEAEYSDTYFDFINLYVPPFAQEVLKKYNFKADDEIVLFPLYPHHSQTTVTTSLEVVQKAIEELKIKAKLKELGIFYENELYNEMIIKHILRANEEFKTAHKKHLIFSAHSLPLSIIKKGDLYEKHIQAHLSILKNRLKDYFDVISLGYQSKLGPVKWLEPNTGDLLAKLDKEALVYPLSFCIDCSETIFELEIEYRKIATKDYKVIACPNDSQEFCEFIKAFLS